MYTYTTELFDTALTVMSRAREIKVDDLKSAQDAMINLRVDWEGLQTKLRNRKLDGFEPVVESILQLAATSLSMAAAMRAKILNQRLLQMQRVEDELEEESLAKEVKDRKRKRRGVVV